MESKIGCELKETSMALQLKICNECINMDNVLSKNITVLR
jgi:hypothetical protein